ncbi:unnamed protein product [Rotaria magnacalcarata]|uniref:Uncharacterized protein n=1 Tax=Rotaria magnacalcarata TaxID=392030 RepID=A0A8S3GGJ6_9BILA|nr:unnamed protein product [Rotaria magnacalcarata]
MQEEQQAAAVESLENERNRLEELKMKQTDETNSLREQKETAVNERQTAETEHKEAEKALTNAKQKERDTNNQYQRALNEEQRIKSQLDRVIREETAAKYAMQAAESRVKNLEPTESLWNLVGAIVPVLGGFTQSEVQKVNRVRTELDRAREKYETKQAQVSELREKYATAKDHRKDAAKLRDDAKKDATKQQTITQVKLQNFNTCKATADRLIEEHRSSLRKQQQTETSFRMVSINLQKAQAQCASTTNELKHNEQEKATYGNQINELKSNLDDMREDLNRHQRTIDAHRTTMDENREALQEKQLQCQLEQSKLQLLKGTHE